MKITLPQSGVREIRVKLILAGGHAAMIVLPPEHPMLTQLLTAVAAPVHTETVVPPTLFQIPVEGGRATLTFSSQQLIAVVTDPSILMQPEAEALPASITATPAATAPATTATGADAEPASAVPPAPRIIRHAVAQLDGFLGQDELGWLRETVLAAQPRFQPSWTTDDNKDYRKSMVLNAPDEVVRLVVGKIRAAMPAVMANLKLPAFPVGRIECQVTANTDGSYFRVHTDSGTTQIDATRQLTYVYYFNREPKGFAGGELRVYDDQVRNDKLARTDAFRVFEPRNNSIVFFPAVSMHEVTAVQVPSQDFRDSRFTVNGWIHRT